MGLGLLMQIVLATLTKPEMFWKNWIKMPMGKCLLLIVLVWTFMAKAVECTAMKNLVVLQPIMYMPELDCIVLSVCIGQKSPYNEISQWELYHN